MGVVGGNAHAAEVITTGNARAEAFFGEFFAVFFGVHAGIADIALHIKAGAAGKSGGRKAGAQNQYEYFFHV